MRWCLINPDFNFISNKRVCGSLWCTLSQLCQMFNISFDHPKTPLNMTCLAGYMEGWIGWKHLLFNWNFNFPDASHHVCIFANYQTKACQHNLSSLSDFINAQWKRMTLLMGCMFVFSHLLMQNFFIKVFFYWVNMHMFKDRANSLSQDIKKTVLLSALSVGLLVSSPASHKQYIL